MKILLFLYNYVAAMLSPTAKPKFTPGQTVVLVKEFPAELSELAMYAPVQGVVHPYSKLDHEMGTVPVKFDHSMLVHHMRPESLKAVLSEI